MILRGFDFAALAAARGDRLRAEIQALEAGADGPSATAERLWARFSDLDARVGSLEKRLADLRAQDPELDRAAPYGLAWAWMRAEGNRQRDCGREQLRREREAEPKAQPSRDAWGFLARAHALFDASDHLRATIQQDLEQRRPVVIEE